MSKMSEVFKLPLEICRSGKICREELAYKINGLDWPVKKQVEAIIVAVNSHDTLTAELEVAQGRLDICQNKSECYKTRWESVRADLTEVVDVLRRYDEMIENYVTLETQIPLDMPEYKSEAELISEVHKILTKHGSK